MDKLWQSFLMILQFYNRFIKICQGMKQNEIDFSYEGKGSGSSGILNSTNEDQRKCVPLVFQFNVKDISISSSFLMAITQTQQLSVWGVMNTTKIPKPLRLMEKVEQISCGWDHALFTTQESMWGVGSNKYQELGFGSFQKYFEKPVEIIIEPVLFVAAGFRQSYVLKQSCLMGCGQSKKYELGKVINKPSYWSNIFEGNIGANITKMICGKRFVLLLTQNHQIFALGFNEENCFNSKNTHFVKPTLIFTEVQQVTCGWAHITLLKLDKTVQSYGRNNLGQLGHGKQTNTVKFELNQQQQIEKIVSGSQFTFAITDQYRLFGWGWNEHYNITQSESKILPTPLLIDHSVKRCTNVWTNPALTIIQGYK